MNTRLKTADLPAKCCQNMIDIHGEADGAAFLERILESRAQLANAWELRLDGSCPELSYNYVESGATRTGAPIMLNPLPFFIITMTATLTPRAHSPIRWTFCAMRPI